MEKNSCHDNIFCVNKIYILTSYTTISNALFSIPYTFSETTLGLYNFLLKYLSFWFRVFSLKPLISHCNLGKAESPIVIVTRGISPASPKLIPLFGIMLPRLISWNNVECRSKRASWILPGASVVKWRKRLLCPISPMLVMVYLFLKLKWFFKWVDTWTWNPSKTPTQGNS